MSEPRQIELSDFTAQAVKLEEGELLVFTTPQPVPPPQQARIRALIREHVGAKVPFLLMTNGATLKTMPVNELAMNGLQRVAQAEGIGKRMIDDALTAWRRKRRDAGNEGPEFVQAESYIEALQTARFLLFGERLAEPG